MDNSTIVLLINDNARAIKAVYEPDATPEIFKTLDPTISVDDLLVVESSTRHGKTVVKVTEVDIDINFDTQGKVKWAVCKIDETAFEAILSQEKDAIAAVQSAERRRKKEALRRSMFEDHADKIKTLEIADYTEEGVTE